MLNRRFWEQVIERALKSLGQSVVLNAGAVVFDAFEASWVTIGGLALGAAALSVATSLASFPLSPRGTPSLVDPLPAPVVREDPEDLP